MVVEWLSNDGKNTLGHVSVLELEGNKTTGPHHALTNRDYQAIRNINDEEHLLTNSLTAAGEALSYATFQNIGTDANVTDALTKRIENRIVSNTINLAYTRIPSSYDINGIRVPTEDRVSVLKASALVGAQLDAGVSAVVPPLPNGLSSIPIFKRIMQRTTSEIELFDKDKEIVGLIPAMSKNLDKIPQIVKEYVKNDVRVFAMDFSGAALPRSFIRTTVRAIRESLKIKKDNEPQEKHYYLHAFNTSVNMKSSLPVTPVADILTHAYSVDSTSSVMWGGGELEFEKLRYYNIGDYGAYRIGKLDDYSNVKVPFALPQDDPVEAYNRLRAHRIIDYAQDCKTTISQKIGSNTPNSDYAAYLLSKPRTVNQVQNILTDVEEIKAV